MMYISCGVKQDFIIDLLEQGEHDGIQYTYEGKTGIKLAFSINSDDIDRAIEVAKQAIKKSDVGSVLYFQITK